MLQNFLAKECDILEWYTLTKDPPNIGYLLGIRPILSYYRTFGYAVYENIRLDRIYMATYLVKNTENLTQVQT